MLAVADDFTANAIHKDVAKTLRSRRHDVGKVWRVYSAGESGTGDTTVLFTTMQNEPKTGLIGCEAYVKITSEGEEEPGYRTVVVVLEGWPADL